MEAVSIKHQKVSFAQLCDLGHFETLCTFRFYCRDIDLQNQDESFYKVEVSRQFLHLLEIITSKSLNCIL